MRACLYLGGLVMLAGCSESAQLGACDLKPQLELRLMGDDPLDCGELEVNANSEARQSARGCASKALDERRAFKLVAWGLQAGRKVADAYTYAGGEALVSIVHYDSAASAETGAQLTEQVCHGLRGAEGCDVQVADGLCLECAMLVEASIACQEHVDPSACRSAGNYQAGKEGSYQPCCPGLTEVFQRSKGEVNGLPACGDLPLRVYACVEGRCGDGRCEAPENVPCGCALDCPDLTPNP